MKKTLTLSLILLTMSAPALVLAQSPTAAQTALIQARAALAQAQAARAAQSATVGKPAAVKAAAPLAQAQPAAPAAASSLQPAAWTKASLNAGTFLVLPASMDGDPDTFSFDQQQALLTAMQHDLQGAVTRKYPGARFVTDANTPGVIVLRPVLTVPVALVPWNSFQARVEITQNGGSALLKDTFGVLELYQHQTEAANYVFDRLVSKLP